MFLYLSVSHSVHRGSVSQHAMGQTVSDRHTPWYYPIRTTNGWYTYLLPPATKLGQGNIFTGVCDSVRKGVSGPGGCLVWGGSALGEGCLVWGEWVSAPRGVPGDGYCCGGTHPTGIHTCYVSRLFTVCFVHVYLCACVLGVCVFYR